MLFTHNLPRPIRLPIAEPDDSMSGRYLWHKFEEDFLVFCSRSETFAKSPMEDYVVENYKHGQVAFAGKSQIKSDSIRLAVKRVATVKLLKKYSDIFVFSSADGVVIKNKEGKHRTVICISDGSLGICEAVLSSAKDSSLELLSGRDLIWSNDGLHPFWGGVTVDEGSGVDSERWHLLEPNSIHTDRRRFTLPLKRPYVNSPPLSTILFLDSGNSPLTEISAEEAWKRLSEKREAFPWNIDQASGLKLRFDNLVAKTTPKFATAGGAGGRVTTQSIQKLLSQTN